MKMCVITRGLRTSQGVSTSATTGVLKALTVSVRVCACVHMRMRLCSVYVSMRVCLCMCVFTWVCSVYVCAYERVDSCCSVAHKLGSRIKLVAGVG